jgi:hypothetical protein
MNCKCIKKCNEALERDGSNMRIDVPLMFDLHTGKTKPPRCAIVTCKNDPRKRERLKTLLATYCPICGKKY